MSSRTFNQEVFEEVLALARLEWAVAANGRHFAPGCRPWLGFKSDNFVLCRADGAMEQRCYRFRHTRKIAIRQPSGSARRTGQTCIMAFVNLTYYNSAAVAGAGNARRQGVLLFLDERGKLNRPIVQNFDVRSGSRGWVSSWLSLAQPVSLAVAVQQEFFAVDGTELDLTRALKAKAYTLVYWKMLQSVMAVTNATIPIWAIQIM